MHHTEGTSAAALAPFSLHQDSKGYTGMLHPLSPLAAPSKGNPHSVPLARAVCAQPPAGLCRQGAEASLVAAVASMGTAEHGADQAFPNALCPAMADLPMRGVTQATTTFIAWLEEPQSLENWCSASRSSSKPRARAASTAFIRVKQQCHPVAGEPMVPSAHHRNRDNIYLP